MPTAEVGPEPALLLLDTHVWIWTMEGAASEFSAATVSMIEEAAARGDLSVSAISVWEVAMLEARRRITLSRSLDEWVRSALTAPGMRLVDLSPEISLESARLPGRPPRDPADRILVATARVFGCTLVTRDKQILAYGKSGHVRTRNGRGRRK